MQETLNSTGPQPEALTEYHERIKADVATYMLKRMVGDVTTTDERPEFMNACIAAAATLAAGQSVFLTQQTKNADQKKELLETGLDNAIEMVKASYDAYITAALKPQND